MKSQINQTLADSSINLVKNKSEFQRIIQQLKKEKVLWLISGIALVWVITFCYIPMLGNVVAFFNYYPGKSLFESEFVGLKHFIEFFHLPDVWLILRNTLAISTLNLTIGFVSPIIFALLLNEVYNTRFKKFVQTVSYLPHFVSWVVVASIMVTLLGNEGLVNEVLMRLGIIETPIKFMTKGENFWWMLLFANIWKGVGWSAIIYISAIAGIDQELYQAGAVDGLSRFGMIRHITLPGIAPTIILLFILGIGGILNAGFEQQLLLGTPQTRDYHEVIDTYVYRYGIQLGRYSFATAVSLMKSVIGFALVVISNKLSKKFTDMAIF